MRKIYSLVLMAAALLVGTNANAATLTVGATGSYLTLESAFSAASSGDVIQLVGDVSVTQAIEINGKNLTLDMNGHEAEMTSYNKSEGVKRPWMFAFFKGSLNVIGQGTLKNSLGTGFVLDSYEIIVFKLFGSYNNESEVTHLTIGKDVEVVANPGKAGINIDNIAPYSNPSKDGVTYVPGTITVPDEKAQEIWKLSAKTTTPEGCTKIALEHCAKAYGVVVDIYGKVEGQKYGVQISGNLSHMENTPEAKANWPKVNIKPGSEVKSQPEENESIGFYAAGQGNSMVEGEVHASTGVYVKGGAVEIHDAYVHSDNSNYSAPEAKTSGVDACGSAVVVDSKIGYAGGQEVKISGDTKLQGVGGYAIEEVITDPEGTTKVSSVAIEGGIIDGGNQGAMAFTTQTATGDENSKVTVYDGTFTGKTKIGDSEQDKLDVVLPVDGTKKHVTIVDGVAIVSDGPTPTPATQDINELSENADVQYNDETLREMTLSGNKTLKVVELIGKESLTIPADKTLKVDKLILGKDAQIEIAVGGVLIITGKAGIVSDDPKCLVIKASADGMGALVFNPENQTNRSPWATVEYYATAHERPNGSHSFDIFAFPFVKGTVSATNNPAVATNWQHVVDGSWVEFHNESGYYAAFKEEAEPFEAIAITTTNEEITATTFSFKGQLQGNISGKFEMKKGFNYIGNGFLGAMNAKVILDQLQNQPVKTVLYTWNGNGYSQENAASIQKMSDAQIKKYLTAMKMFVIYANEDIPALDLNYRSLVYENYVPVNE